MESQMTKLMRNFLGTAALLAATMLLPAAHAEVVRTITFDDPNLVNLYFPGDTFHDSGFAMTPDFDFGTVDVAAALGPVAPIGNSTQFYFNANDGGLIVAQEDGKPFDLLGFSAAFIPLVPPSLQTTVIVALGIDMNNNVFGVAWLFAPPVNGAYPFALYSDPADFAAFTNLQSVEFFACSLVGGQVCTSPTNNNGQFAIDNIRVSFVPEPSSVALLMLALVALGFTLRRKSS
jgi:hypothetical protein